MPTKTQTLGPLAYVQWVNAGGAFYTDTTGLPWQADHPFNVGSWGYVGGWSGYDTGVVSSTLGPVCVADRQWNLSAVPWYRFTVPNGQYLVHSNLVETEWNQAKSKFHVCIESKIVLSYFNTFTAAGGKNIPARDRVFQPLVTDGQLAIDFVQIAGFDRPKVNAIEVKRVYAKLVNAVGAAYGDTAGRQWVADQPYRSGFGYRGSMTGTFTTSHALARTNDPALYQSELNGMTGYRFKVPNGRYRVQLKFAENTYDAAGRRLFDVWAENVVELANSSIWQAAGNWQYAAVDKTFEIDVLDNLLDLSLVSKAGAPKVSAILVQLE